MFRLIVLSVAFALIGAVIWTLVQVSDKISIVLSDSPTTMSDIMKGE